MNPMIWLSTEELMRHNTPFWKRKKYNHNKHEIRMENEIYLAKHQELQLIVDLFLTKLLDEKPDKVLDFAGDFFTQYTLIQAHPQGNH